ncbi:hypothetical protein TSMEX_009362, partial [Taenia solium]
ASKEQRGRINNLQLKLGDLSEEVERLTARLDALERCGEKFKTQPNFPSVKDIEEVQLSIRRLRNMHN